MKSKKILIFRIILLIFILTGIFINLVAKKYSFNLLLSYYTIQSNIIVSIVLILEIINYFRNLNCLKKEETLQNIKGATTIIILITGIIFAVLLTPYTREWKGLRLLSSYILHYISPTMCLIDFLFFDKRTKKLGYKKIIFWFCYPILYYIFGIIRILFLDGFVPYPFMDIKNLGFIKSSMILVSLVIIFYLLAILINFVKNKINVKNYKQC